MGLRDWAAKNVAGPSAYGEVMGREAVKNGLAVGRTIYWGHGTGGHSEQLVCEDENEMISLGFNPYWLDATTVPPVMEDSSELSRQTRIAGIALAAQLNITCMQNFFKDSNNKAEFGRGLVRSLKTELPQLGIAITFPDAAAYTQLPVPDHITKVVNVGKAGTDDEFSIYLREIRRRTGSVCFRRTGPAGFGSMVATLAEETVLAIRGARDKFNW
jgi:hypothetical protein